MGTQVYSTEISSLGVSEGCLEGVLGLSMGIRRMSEGCLWDSTHLVWPHPGTPPPLIIILRYGGKLTVSYSHPSSLWQIGQNMTGGKMLGYHVDDGVDDGVEDDEDHNPDSCASRKWAHCESDYHSCIPGLINLLECPIPPPPLSSPRHRWRR